MVYTNRIGVAILSKSMPLGVVADSNCSLNATEVASPKKEKKSGAATLVADKKNETHATKVASPVGGA